MGWKIDKTEFELQKQIVFYKRNSLQKEKREKKFLKRKLGPTN